MCGASPCSPSAASWRAQHATAGRSSTQELRDLRERDIRSLMRDTLSRAWPGIEQRSASATELEAHGVPAQPPRDSIELAWAGYDPDMA